MAWIQNIQTFDLGIERSAGLTFVFCTCLLEPSSYDISLDVGFVGIKSFVLPPGGRLGPDPKSRILLTVPEVRRKKKRAPKHSVKTVPMGNLHAKARVDMKRPLRTFACKFLCTYYKPVSAKCLTS